MTIKEGTKVRHRKDPALGLGEVELVKKEAGVTKYYTHWPSKPNSLEAHTEADLEPVQDLPARLASGNVGEASFRPFVLRLLGRWFETRHALTGELSNQPFQMLPHQVIVTNRVVNSAPEGRRWLIADDVGLGKTIEAGMIMEVLRKRTLGPFRCLIITPAGLKQQWKEEMERRFSRHFRLFDGHYPNELEESHALIASIDTLRNRRKFERPLQDATPWDLVIFDEAHHLATDTSVQRYDFARRLHEEGKARNTLFLTATPHSGNVEHFYNMLRLLRADLFKTREDVTRGDGRLNQLMIRNRKSEVTDVDGKLIFKGIQPAQILTCTPTRSEVAFYEELLAFVKQGYGVANTLKRERKDTATGNAVGFLMTTFRKLASSSRGAIRTALHNRLRALEEADLAEADGAAEEDERYAGEYEESRVARVALEKPRGKAKAKSPIKNEMDSIKKLLALLEHIDHPDTKVTFFVQKLRELPVTEKGLIFTEYRGTQRTLVDALQEKFGQDAVGVIHGSMGTDERQRQVAQFNDEALPRFLVSTEAGGEGLNMQRACHVVFNYDLPWNPNRLQQRIGRVYRYGQTQKVQVYNIRLSSESEAFADARVDEYLRQKIDEITRRLAEVQDGKPEDVQNDVLGQVAQSMSLDELYEQAVTEGEEQAKRTIDQKSGQLEEILKNPEGTLGLFKGLRCFDITDYQKAAARVPDEALAFFVRQYLSREGERVEEDRGLLSFRIPDRLREVSGRARKSDPNEARRDITARRVARVTVTKSVARTTPGARLLRFGDPVFDAMVRHVQDADFSDGVAAIEAPAAALGWRPGDRGVVAVFDLRVVRSEGSVRSAQVLHEELYALAIPQGGSPALVDPFLEQLHRLNAGGLDIDATEINRVYPLARQAAERRAEALKDRSVAEYSSQAGVPEVYDFAIAWCHAY
jgi:superfamily II DNA or RNA helicase